MNTVTLQNKNQEPMFYVNLDGICHSGKKIKEAFGKYLGKYLLIENLETKEQEFVFPDLLKDLEFYKKHKNKRVNRGRRYEE